jgi:FKBP-type peptidyl-prolyl cis-trans isomerase FkpA
MARKTHRAFAMFGAVLFLLTSSATTIAVIYTIAQQNKDNKATNSQQAQAQKALDAAKSQQKENKLEGTKLANFTPVASVPQLKVEDTTPGTGETVKAGDTVTVDYTGALANNGTIFQSSLDTGQTVSFPLSGVIAGWSQGIPGMKVGGTRRLLIPASLAYGSQAQNGIPANSDLVFDVTLHKIGK